MRRVKNNASQELLLEIEAFLRNSRRRRHISTPEAIWTSAVAKQKNKDTSVKYKNTQASRKRYVNKSKLLQCKIKIFY